MDGRKFEEYLYKNIILETNEGKKYKGYVDDVVDKVDNMIDDDIDEYSIGICIPDEHSDEGLEFYESEVKSITIINNK